MASSPATLPPLRRISFGTLSRVKAAAVTVAFFAVFWPLLDFVPPHLGVLIYQWSHEADWSHGWMIPLFSAYLVYVNWDRLKRMPITLPWVGLPILVVGLLAFEYFMFVKPFGYLRAVSMLVALLGVVIMLTGVAAFRITWLPWLYLLFAIPLPKGIYFRLTDPLRQLAATVTTNVLALIPSLDIYRTGSLINYVYGDAHGAIGVADACSGMRSTVTLCALGVAVAFLQPRPWWQRVAMIAACVPIAVFSNFIRVTVTCILHIFVDPRYAEGTYHTMLGLVTLLIAFGIFSGFGWLLSHLVVEEEDKAAAPAKAGE